jgi:hypothetical protein
VLPVTFGRDGEQGSDAKLRTTSLIGRDQATRTCTYGPAEASGSDYVLPPHLIAFGYYRTDDSNTAGSIIN